MDFRPSDPATWHPRCFDVEVTTRCNLGCRYCYLGKPTDCDMSKDTADLVLRMLFRRAVRRETSELNFYGGEPFANFPIVQHFAENLVGRSRCTIFTNGATATEDQVQWCLDHQITPKRSTAGCPEAAELTRPGDYTKRWLAEGRLWQDYHASRRLTVIPETAHLVSRSVRWLHDEGYDGPIDIATDDYREWPPEAQAAYESEMRGLAADFVSKFSLGNILGIENFTNFGRCIFGQSGVTVFGCGAGWNTWGVAVDGTVVPCHRFFRELTLPRTHISAILAGQRVDFGPQLLETVSSWAHSREREECKRCSARQPCARGCMHVGLATGGGLYSSPRTRCRFTRLYAELAWWIGERLGVSGWWNMPATHCSWEE